MALPEDSIDSHVVESAERLDLRWYRVNMNGKTWLVDYSDPTDLRLFFPGLFPECSRCLRVWDMEDLPRSIVECPGKTVRRERRWFEALYCALFIDCLFLPHPFNLGLFTYSPLVGRYWYVAVLAVFIVELIVMVMLSRCFTSKIDPGDAPCKHMVLIDKKTNEKSRSRVFIVARWLACFAIAMAAIVLFLIVDSSYAVFVLVFAIPSIEIRFGRLIYFEPLRSRHRYAISDTQKTEIGANCK